MEREFRTEWTASPPRRPNEGHVCIDVARPPSHSVLTRHSQRRRGSSRDSRGESKSGRESRENFLEGGVGARKRARRFFDKILEERENFWKFRETVKGVSFTVSLSLSLCLSVSRFLCLSSVLLSLCLYSRNSQ